MFVVGALTHSRPGYSRQGSRRMTTVAREKPNDGSFFWSHGIAVGNELGDVAISTRIPIAHGAHHPTPSHRTLPPLPSKRPIGGWGQVSCRSDRINPNRRPLPLVAMIRMDPSDPRGWARTAASQTQQEGEHCLRRTVPVDRPVQMCSVSGPKTRSHSWHPTIPRSLRPR